MFIRLLTFLLLVSILSGCDKPKTTEYFLTHPEKIQPTYDQCVSLVNTITFDQKQECIAVLRAIPIFRGYLMEVMTNSRLFGLHIMQAEIELVKLQNALKLAEKNNISNSRLVRSLKEKIELQMLQVNARLAIIRLLEQIRQ